MKCHTCSLEVSVCLEALNCHLAVKHKGHRMHFTSSSLQLARFIKIVTNMDDFS